MPLPAPTPKSYEAIKALPPQKQTFFRSYATVGLNALRLNVHILGNLKIHFNATDQATISISAPEELLPEKVALQGETLIIEGQPLISWANKSRNKLVAIDLHLPEHTRVSLSFIVGVIHLFGGTGPLDIRGKIGEIAGQSFSRDLKIDLRSGDIQLNEPAGKTDIEMLYGNMKLGWSALSGAENLRVHCAAGGIELLLPPGSTDSRQTNRGGVFLSRRFSTNEGAEIHATVGIGSLIVTHGR